MPSSDDNAYRQYELNGHRMGPFSDIPPFKPTDIMSKRRYTKTLHRIAAIMEPHLEYIAQYLRELFGEDEEISLIDPGKFIDSKEQLLECYDEIIDVPVCANAMWVNIPKDAWSYNYIGKLGKYTVFQTHARLDIDPLIILPALFCKKSERADIEKLLQAHSIKHDIILPLDKVILPEDIKDRFKRSTADFLFNSALKQRFMDHYMKFKRCVLIYGPPGNGKSTLINWVRGVMKQNRNTRILTWEDLTSPHFGSRDKMIKTLYILEDIDTVITQRDSTIYGSNKNSTFSQVLNLLDGATYQDNYLVVMTANDINVLDKALLRDGRADEKFEIKYPTEELKWRYIQELIVPLIPDMPEAELRSKFDSVLHTPEVPFSTLDNIRKKLFIYGSLDDALETTLLRLDGTTTSSPKVGFTK